MKPLVKIGSYMIEEYQISIEKEEFLDFGKDLR